jgi:hypothetical protein
MTLLPALPRVPSCGAGVDLDDDEERRRRGETDGEAACAVERSSDSRGKDGVAAP